MCRSPLDPCETSSCTHQPGDSLVRIALADDHGDSITGYALCGYRLAGQQSTPVGDRWLCVVCEHLADGTARSQGRRRA